MSKQIKEMAKALIDAINEKHGHISMRGLAEALYNAGIRKQNEWIPVTERLPEKEDGKVLVTDGIQVNFSYRNHFYRDQGGTLRVPANYGHGVNVTHWMPIPEPPENGVTDTNVGDKSSWVFASLDEIIDCYGKYPETEKGDEGK